MLIDSHTHLDSVEDLRIVLTRAKSEGIEKIVTVGTSIEASKKSVEISEKYSSNVVKIYATCGIYPQDGEKEIKNLGLYQCINSLIQITKTSDRVIGIGETGLDYRLTTNPSTSHSTLRDGSSDSDSKSSGQLRQLTTDKEKAFQKELFRAQIKLAAQLKLPLVIHCRNAFDETFDLLSVVKCQLSNVTGVFHSWTGDWNAAKKALDLGFYISFSGIVTFKNAKDIQEVAQKVPLNRMLLETDSPYLSPQPYRGKPNEPKNVKIVAQFIADLRGQPFDKIAEVTSRNAERLFGI